MVFVCFDVDLQKVAEPHLFQRFLMNTKFQILAYKTPMSMYIFYLAIQERYNLDQILALRSAIVLLWTSVSKKLHLIQSSPI